MEPKGFYDALLAYGLPASITDFDRSAQSDVPYRVKTAFGLTEPFLVSGVTKQGGLISPLKSTLTTSLGNRWLQDLALLDPGALVVHSHASLQNAPHVPTDSLALPVSMVEAMDDLQIFGCSLTYIRKACFFMERFQAAYG